MNTSNENRTLFILLVLMGVATVVVFAMCQPFQGLKLAVKFYGIAFICTLFGTVGFSKRLASGEAEGSMSLLFPYVTDHRYLLICAILALPLMDSVIFINTWFDTSTATRMTAIVVSKQIVGGTRVGANVDELSIRSPVSPTSLSTSDTEDFPFPGDEYVLVVPGKTRIEFNMHPGFLGFPWREGGFRIIY